MTAISSFIMGNNNNIMKKSAVWNLISSIEYSLQSAILLLVVTRVNGLFDAGVFTIAYTVTQMMSTIGSYGMRSFQVSDIKNEYSFNTYFNSRIVSTLAMIIICMSYAFIQGYDMNKITIMVWLCGYRVLESMEDVFHGEIQKSARLDVASKIVAARIFIASVIFGMAYAISKDLLFASMLFTVSAWTASIIMNLSVIREFENIKIKLSMNRVTKLLVVCLPICISGYLYNYLVNAPKYAIDRNMSEEAQSLFSILFMPIFAINMLSSFIFKPMIVNMGVMWNNEENKQFIRKVICQLLIIAGITLTVMLAGGLIGVDILGWLYGVDLTDYRFLFTIMMMFGGFAAIVAFMVVVLTIMRKQNYIIVAYGIAMIVDLLCINQVVKRYALMGAGIMYGVAMGIIMIFLLTVFVIAMQRRMNKENA